MTSIDVRRSPIEGLGVFAPRPFGAEERITQVHIVREITAERPLREDLGERAEHCAYPDGRVVLVAYPERHVNHSCDPNAYEFFEGQTSYLVARRGIREGEEITIDYNVNISDGTAWPCHCGAARCAGDVAGDFFRLSLDRQLEYRPLLATWFVERHRTRVEALDTLRARRP
jgi:hypothetical protein